MLKAFKVYDGGKEICTTVADINFDNESITQLAQVVINEGFFGRRLINILYIKDMGYGIVIPEHITDEMNVKIEKMDRDNSKKTFVCIRCGSTINNIFRTEGKDNQCQHCIKLENEEEKRKQIKQTLNAKYGYDMINSFYGLPGRPRPFRIDSTENINDKYRQIKEIINIQGTDGNWNFDSYTLGLFNGMEMLVSILEDREPIFRRCEGEDFLDETTITLDKCTHIACDFNHADLCFLKKDSDKSLCMINKTKEAKQVPSIRGLRNCNFSDEDLELARPFLDIILMGLKTRRNK
jgi:hypothetical protein